MPRGKKAADGQVRKGKSRQCQHPQCAAESSPPPASPFWVRKQERKAGQKPVVRHALGKVGWPPSCPLKTSWQTLGEGTCWKAWGRDGHSGRKQCSAYQADWESAANFKKLPWLSKNWAIHWDICKCSLCHDTSPRQMFLMFEQQLFMVLFPHQVKWARTLFPKTSCSVLNATRPPTRCCCCPRYSNQGKIQPSTMAALYKETMEEEQRMINRAGTHSADLHKFPPKMSGERHAFLEGDWDA